MLRRALFLAATALLMSAAIALGQSGGPDLPPAPDLPPPAAKPSTPRTTTPRTTPRTTTPRTTEPSTATPAPTGPSQADLLAQRRREEAAARRERQRQAAIRRERARQAALLRKRVELVRSTVTGAATAVGTEVPGLVGSIPLPLPPKPPSPATVPDSGGSGGTIAIVLGLIVAAGGAAFLVRRQGGRRLADRVGIGNVAALDPRHLGIALTAVFVVTAAVLAAVLAYIIINPAAVG